MLEESLEEQKLKKSNRIKKLLFFIITLLFVVIVSIGVWFFELRNTNPIPENIRKQVNFSIYYPADIKIDKGSIKLTDSKLLTYLIHYEGSIMYVSIQPKPHYFDFASFDKGMKQSFTVTTGYGTATIGQLGGRLVADLPTVDSWVLASSPTTTPPKNLVYILQHLKSK